MIRRRFRLAAPGVCPLSLAVCIALTGCIELPASGLDSPEARRRQIWRMIDPADPAAPLRLGVTTQAQVRDLLGEPNGWQHNNFSSSLPLEDLTDGGKTWYYDFGTTPAVRVYFVPLKDITPFRPYELSGAYHLVLRFDSAGVLRDWDTDAIDPRPWPPNRADRADPAATTRASERRRP